MKRFFKGFKLGMKEFGESITTIINSTLLLIVYLVGAGVTSIFAKLIKKKFLYTKKENDSYWKELNLKKKPMKRYYRQF